MTENDNTSFVFFPFRVNPHLFERITDIISGGKWWQPDEVDLKYFFRFVGNKVNGKQGQHRCCRYVLKQKLPDGFCFLNRACTRVPKPGYESTPVAEWFEGTFSIVPEDMELYMFTTGVGLLVMKIKINDADEATLINARSVIKKVAATQYRFDNEEACFTLLGVAEKTVAEITERIARESNDEPAASFFYFTGEENTLAYMTTLYYHSEKLSDMSRLYLQYNDSLDRNLSQLHMERLNTVSISDSLTWNISDQSSICVCSGFEGSEFLNDQFLKNFVREYLYMFVFLLHQKYMLYHLLMQIDTHLENSLDRLEEYKKALSDFKTYFVFSRVSEVRNYQLVYDETGRAFSLEHMYEDVQEPLQMLDKILQREEEKKHAQAVQREQQAEKKQVKRERRLNIALAVLSVLGVISAFNDGNDFISKIARFYTPNGEPASITINIVFSVLLTIGLIGVVVFYLIRRKRDMKSNCIYTGVFLNSNDLKAALEQTGQPLDALAVPIAQPHVTAAYKPKEVPSHLFGEKVRVIITGYGRSNENEGVSVELHADNPELDRLLQDIKKVKVPHITLSISEKGKAVNTKDLDFKPVQKIAELTGTFGEMLPNNIVNTNKTA